VTPLHGVIPPVCTPLTETLDVDIPSLERLIDFLLESGVDGLFVLGSSGETAYLPDRSRRTVLEVAVSRAAGQVPVLAGVIDTATLRVLDHAEAAQKAGADGIVATAPFYTRTHPAEIERHFRLVAAGVDLPLYAYDLPVSVHLKLDAELLLALARDGVIRGLKDSSGDDGGFRRLALAKQDLADFSLLTGSELTVDSALRIGGDGVVPGLGNVDPAGYARLYRHAQGGNWDAAADEQIRLIRLFEIIRVGDAQRMGPSSAALGAFKMALHLRGIIDCPITAPPQIPLDSGETGEIRRLLEVAGLL
jgi:4-hydroxy-tetrahydrodipicolinate synthase